MSTDIKKRTANPASFKHLFLLVRKHNYEASLIERLIQFKSHVRFINELVELWQHAQVNIILYIFQGQYRRLTIESK